MNRIYITSDLHLNHNREFIYKPRGFINIEEHDRVIINNINKKVGENDILYILGDEMLGEHTVALDKFKQIKCKNIYIIAGNHTTNTRISLLSQLSNVLKISYADMIHYKKFHFYLSHFPTKTGNYDDERAPWSRTWNLCGHVHTNDKFKEMKEGLPSYHVELDAHHCYPISLDEIIVDIKENFFKFQKINNN